MKFKIILPDSIVKELEHDYQLELARITVRQSQTLKESSDKAKPVLLIKPTFEMFVAYTVLELFRERRKKSENLL